MTAGLDRLFTFAGGDVGRWRVERCHAVIGEALPHAARVAVSAGAATTSSAAWSLTGIVSNERYVERQERAALVSKQEGLGRPSSLCAALIPIRKSAAWWVLPQDERRQILESQSRHIGIGLRYLPAIARRLHHCRDLGADQPFDFLTWFEYSPSDAELFDELVGALRSTVEWKYVEREAELRLFREGV